MRLRSLKCHPSLKDRTLVRGKFSSSPSPASYDGEMTPGAFLQTPRSVGTTSWGWSGFGPQPALPSHGTLGSSLPALRIKCEVRPGETQWEHCETPAPLFYFWLRNYPLSSLSESHGPASGHLAKSTPPTPPPLAKSQKAEAIRG